MGSFELYRSYLTAFMNPFPGHNIPQTFISHTTDITTVHDYMDKINIKLVFFGIKLHKTYTVFNFLTPTHHRT